ncbi:MAG: HAD-IB family phosphatase [Chloroflexi bacterium]|mgnify:FL=1|jgi:HAD superfamily phosphoserine phosphatase-like hydrolase|nr:HAD-IB family phosphatase [Chloroflexota bacterium]
MNIIVTDLEGTLTTGSSWRGFRSYFKQNYSALAYNLFFARFLLRFPLMKLGLLNHQKTMSAWMKAEIRLMQGNPITEINAMAESVIYQEMWPKRRPDVLLELEKKRLAGAQIVIVSTAYQPIVEAFARKIEARAIGTQLVCENGKLDGIELPVNSYHHKAENILIRYPDAHIVAAYGDTLSDLPMMETSQQPVAVYPDAKLLNVAGERGWRIMPSGYREQ